MIKFYTDGGYIHKMNVPNPRSTIWNGYTVYDTELEAVEAGMRLMELQVKLSKTKIEYLKNRKVTLAQNELDKLPTIV